MSLDGYHLAPRRLRFLLEDGDVTPTEFLVLWYVALCGADRPEGVWTRRSELAGALRVSDKTVSGSLRRLRELGLVQYDLRQRQRARFRIRLGVEAQVGL